MTNWFKVKLEIISFVITAMPVLVFPILYNTAKVNPAPIIFVAPRRIRNFSLDALINELPIIAACPEPNPGRKQHNGEEIEDAKIGAIKSFLFIFGFSIICLGIFIFELMLIIKEDAPNNPERRGRNGWFTFEFNTAMPKNPEIIKTIIAGSLLFSFEIKKIEEASNI